MNSSRSVPLLRWEKYLFNRTPASSPFLGLLIHGGGGTLWDNSSPTHKWLSNCQITALTANPSPNTNMTNLCHRIYSIELPSHGENIGKITSSTGFTNPTDFTTINDEFNTAVPTVATHITQFNNTIANIFNDYNTDSCTNNPNVDHDSLNDSIINNTNKIVKPPILLISFSLGASFVLKSLETISKFCDINESVVIVIGCMPQVAGRYVYDCSCDDKKENEEKNKNGDSDVLMSINETWTKFWTPEINKQLNKGKIAENLQLLHGNCSDGEKNNNNNNNDNNNWYEMCNAVKQWFAIGSDLELNDKEYKFLMDCQNVYYIIGEYENVYPIDYANEPLKWDLKYVSKHVQLIPSDHFNYFNVKNGWPYVENALNCVVMNQIQGKGSIKLPLTGQLLQQAISKL